MKESNDQFFKESRDLILNLLKLYAVNEGRLLEIGSGTADFAVYFAKSLPKLNWICSDLKKNQANLKKQFLGKALPNLFGPEVLEIGKDDFPGDAPFQYVFTADTLHHFSWKENKTLFKLLGKRLREGSLVFFYGPFHYNGSYLSDSHEQYDKNLKASNPNSGIRNFEDVVSGMKKNGFKLLGEDKMPDDKKMLVFERMAF
jgi:cyclopropane fatty-acyl-phospholipid synthase-like methyltransferase